MTFENPVIKDQIDKVVGISNENSFLSGFKTEPVAKFKQEFFNMIQQFRFQMGLTHHLAGFQAQKLKHIGITDCGL